MEIDWEKVEQEADTGIMNKYAVSLMLGEYHRQLEEEHGKNAALLRASIMAEVEERFDIQPLLRHYHRTIGATQLRTGYPYVGDLPALDKTATCDCEGRKKLQKARWLRPSESGEGKGFHWYIGNWPTDRCPLCERALP